jgi:hypothetical protein
MTRGRDSGKRQGHLPGMICYFDSKEGNGVTGNGLSSNRWRAVSTPFDDVDQTQPINGDEEATRFSPGGTHRLRLASRRRPEQHPAIGDERIVLVIFS